MVKTIEIYKKDVSTEEWEQALNRRESGDKYKITGADYWFEWSDDSFRLLLRDSGLIGGNIVTGKQIGRAHV